MGVAGLRDGIILAILAGLSGTLPVEEDADLRARWIFAITIELCRLALKKFTGKEKPATRSVRLWVFVLT